MSLSKAIYLTPPSLAKDSSRISVFLARSLELDNISDFTFSISHLPIIIFDPCRNDWDTSWRSINDVEFARQAEWEIAQLEKANVIILFFHPGTMYGSKLLELGLYIKDRKIITYCPQTYSMRGYVEFMCRRHKIPLLETKDELKKYTIKYLEELITKS
jgi:hypothetical protein